MHPIQERWDKQGDRRRTTWQRKDGRIDWFVCTQTYPLDMFLEAITYTRARGSPAHKSKEPNSRGRQPRIGSTWFDMYSRILICEWIKKFTMRKFSPFNEPTSYEDDISYWVFTCTKGREVEKGHVPYRGMWDYDGGGLLSLAIWLHKTHLLSPPHFYLTAR